MFRILTRKPEPEPPATVDADVEPTVLAPERPVEQPEPTSRRRTLTLAALGGVGLGAVTWFGVVPALAGGGGAPVEALPASSMAVQSGAPAPAPGTPEPAAAGGPPAPGAAPPAPGAASAARGAAPDRRGRTLPAEPRDPFAPLAEVGEGEDDRPEPVTVRPDPDADPVPTPGAASTPTPAASAPPPAPSRAAPSPAPARTAPGVEFTGEPVTLRLLTVTAPGAGEPGEARATLGGLLLRLQPGEQVAALTLLAVGDPCAAFTVAGQPFVLCEGQERTLHRS